MTDELLDDYEKTTEIGETFRSPIIALLEIIVIAIGILVTLFIFYFGLITLTDEIFATGMILFLWAWLTAPMWYALQWRYYSIKVEAGEEHYRQLTKGLIVLPWLFSWLLFLPNILALLVAMVAFILSILSGELILNTLLGIETFLVVVWVIFLAIHIYYFVITSTAVNKAQAIHNKRKRNQL